MALRPIPPRILRHSIVLKVCADVDVWQNPVWTEYPIDRVVMQPSHETRRTIQNTEVTLRGLCFIDARLSSPNVDIAALQRASEEAGQPMLLNFRGVEYTVQSVETLYDDEGLLHHWEVGLV